MNLAPKHFNISGERAGRPERAFAEAPLDIASEILRIAARGMKREDILECLVSLGAECERAGMTEVPLAVQVFKSELEIEVTREEQELRRLEAEKQQCERHEKLALIEDVFDMDSLPPLILKGDTEVAQGRLAHIQRTIDMLETCRSPLLLDRINAYVALRGFYAECLKVLADRTPLIRKVLFEGLLGNTNTPKLREDIERKIGALTPKVSYVSFTGEADIAKVQILKNGLPILKVDIGNNESEAQEGLHVYSEMSGEVPANTWSGVLREGPISYRKAGAEMTARNKHASFSFKLPQPYLEGEGVYELAVSYRGEAESPVRIFTGAGYQKLGTLAPSRVFIEQTFEVDPAFLRSLMPE